MRWYLPTHGCAPAAASGVEACTSVQVGPGIALHTVCTPPPLKHTCVVCAETPRALVTYPNVGLVLNQQGCKHAYPWRHMCFYPFNTPAAKAPPLGRCTHARRTRPGRGSGGPIASLRHHLSSPPCVHPLATTAAWLHASHNPRPTTRWRNQNRQCLLTTVQITTNRSLRISQSTRCGGACPSTCWCSLDESAYPDRPQLVFPQQQVWSSLFY